MEQVEIRSEKVRNLIGIIPPLLIRGGNLLIFFLLIVIVIVGSLIKVSNTLSCGVQVHKRDDNTIQLAIVSISKIITKPIEKGKSVKIYFVQVKVLVQIVPETRMACYYMLAH